ncbi:hypothetical protein [Mesorhizobium sp. M8A.F.Ca.ET.021.01.1.1]|uniref:hypothetical protein n=1 Tax=Mesorhizobium sp. M8A.F.Ca.ET.021.01.1.1 TaxID=2496757 RepID=UPI000FCBD820|nr:hypothetical protein [Mesorhizobium sp. M8A.F.Ca.ET.021.01.1.1]RUW47812.1 hypothetical protein EOA36_22170 [Mesorhizobium sp. M8A.F.Ca.ET.021.01.1.1]
MGGMTQPNFSLEDVRARRRQIAQEDRELAFIEEGLLKLAERWQSLREKAVEYTATIEPARVRERPTITGITSGIPLPQKAKTKNALIIEALTQPRGLWQTANQIRDYLAKETGKIVPMSSISPALTDLKKSGTIARKDMLVALAFRLEKEEPGFLNENGPPEGGPDVEQDSAPVQSPNPTPTVYD